MADTEYRFRTALGGFHKGDVTGYIVKAAAQHRNEILEYEALVTSLREENRSLQQQLNLLMMATPVAAAPAEPVVEETPVQTPEVAPAPEVDMVSMELQAYRRAEAVERTANVRARQLYQKMEDLCDNAMGDFQTADSAVKQAIAVMMEQATNLEQAYQALSDALNASRGKLTAINEQFFVQDDEEK